MKTLSLPARLPLVVLVICTALFCCRHKKSPLPEVAVRPDFEQNPPIATELQLQVLQEPAEEGNLLVTARFDNNRLAEKYHALMLGDEKMVLRDDGQGGDATAGDGMYSILVQEDIGALQAALNTMQENAFRRQREGRLFSFVNRSAVAIKELRLFDTAVFARGGVIHFDPGIFSRGAEDVLKDHSLMITDTLVTHDPTRTVNPCTGAGTPNGAWTFEHLMTEMANTPATGVPVQDFVKAWLDTWLHNNAVNGFFTGTRTLIFFQYIKPWLVKSGIPGASITMANWKTFNFNLRFAPFRLLAIVNRLDLRGNSGYGFNNGGEGRLIFGTVDLTACAPTPGTVIFEYGINKKGCSGLVAFAQQWYHLKTIALGTPAYNAALQAITDQFVGANTNPSKPNGSSLNQLRTNEIVFSAPWEMRQLALDPVSHLLKDTTISQEPALHFNAAVPLPEGGDGVLLADYCNANAAAILNTSYTVPLFWPLGSTGHFRSAFTQLDAGGGTLYWDADMATGHTAPSPKITNPDVRHVFSLGTCLGCHGGEAKTNFTQVSPTVVNPGTGSPQLAPFLTGIGADANPGDNDADTHGFFYVSDPAHRPSEANPTLRGFNDLERRAIDLEALVADSCNRKIKTLGLLALLRFKPVNMSH